MIYYVLPRFAMEPRSDKAHDFLSLSNLWDSSCWLQSNQSNQTKQLKPLKPTLMERIHLFCLDVIPGIPGYRIAGHALLNTNAVPALPKIA